MQMAAEWTDPVSLLKGHLRPYRGVWAAIQDIWNTKETNPILWFFPILAYEDFKIDRLAQEKTIYKESSLQGNVHSKDD